MARLIYAAFASLDGYVEDADGSLAWGVPDEQVFAFVNDLERTIGTYLYGRRMYEAMLPWETAHLDAAEAPEAQREFAEIWRAAEKVVYSRTLPVVSTTRTRLESDFDPSAVRKLKESSPSDLSVGGAGLAAVAIAAGLVDEIHVFACPVLLGGGRPMWPVDGNRLDLTLMGERRFSGGTRYLRYEVRV